MFYIKHFVKNIDSKRNSKENNDLVQCVKVLREHSTASCCFIRVFWIHGSILPEGGIKSCSTSSYYPPTHPLYMLHNTHTVYSVHPAPMPVNPSAVNQYTVCPPSPHTI